MVVLLGSAHENLAVLCGLHDQKLQAYNYENFLLNLTSLESCA